MKPRWVARFLPAASPPNPIETATATLRNLSQQGIRIPASVAIPIIEAHKVGDLRNAGADLERNFWIAFGTLNSRIKPAEDAKSYYRRTFYLILTLLLLLQLYHSASTAVQARLVELAPSAQTGSAAARADGVIGLADKQEQQTYIHLAQYLMSFPKVLAFLLPRGDAKSVDVATPDSDVVLARVELDLTTSFIGKFLLPLLYGMLGAIAFVLRRLSDENQTADALRDPRNRYSLRVPIGALSGLAAGWLLQPAVGSTASSLSPFALAFVAGYSAELVFAAMDRIVAAFTSPQGSTSRGSQSPASNDLQNGDQSALGDLNADGNAASYATQAGAIASSAPIDDSEGLGSRALANRALAE